MRREKVGRPSNHEKRKFIVESAEKRGRTGNTDR